MTTADEFDTLYDRVTEALSAANVPPTLKWSLALASAAARAMFLQGIAREMFVGLGETMFEQAPTAHALPRDDFARAEELPPMRVRVVCALRAAGISLEDIETSVMLVMLAAGAAEKLGLTREAWLALCDAMYRDAEDELHALAHETVRGGTPP
jgi:hypothetical protein